MKANPPEKVWWCVNGCGRELTDAGVADHKCTRCDTRVVDLGWRYRDSHGAYCYASTFETLPPEVRRAA